MRRAEPGGGDRRLGEWWGTSEVCGSPSPRTAGAKGRGAPAGQNAGASPSSVPVPSSHGGTNNADAARVVYYVRGYMAMALVRTAPLILRPLSGRTVQLGCTTRDLSSLWVCSIGCVVCAPCAYWSAAACCDCDRTACPCACGLQAAAAPSNVRSRGEGLV